VFVRKYDSDGNELWTRKFGTTGFEIGGGVAVDFEDNVVVTAHTDGSFVGSSAGEEDALVRKYAPDGTEIWTRQFGTSELDQGTHVAVDDLGNVLVAGSTNGGLARNDPVLFDAFVRKYAQDGNELWTRQFGTPEQEFVAGVAVDAAENVVVTGTTRGPLAGSDPAERDVFVRKYDQDGNELWTTQFGTSAYDSSGSVAIDASGDVIVAGSTTGALEGANAGEVDAFLRKLDSDGNETWTIQSGTSESDVGSAVTLDASGNMLLVGDTAGSLAEDNAGEGDIFVRKYDPERDELWTIQYGTPSDDFAFGVAVDSQEAVIVAGGTNGSLDATNAGESDVLVRKHAP
jgi:hypothetical protein